VLRRCLSRLSVRGCEREVAIGRRMNFTLAEARRYREEHGERVPARPSVVNVVNVVEGASP
jgi:hypothetical protein